MGTTAPEPSHALSGEDHDGGRTTHPKTDTAAPDIRRAEAAEGRAASPGIAIPGPAAQHAGYLIPGFPGRTVYRRAGVAIMPGVLAPFPHIAVHVVQAEGVG